MTYQVWKCLYVTESQWNLNFVMLFFINLHNVIWSAKVFQICLSKIFKFGEFTWTLFLYTSVQQSVRKKSINFSNKCLFFNRKTSGDTLELMEESLDINLLNNAVRLKFQNCSVLPGGVYVSETQNHVIILMLTNQTVHRLLLPHPSRMYRSVSWLSAICFISQITLGVTNLVLERYLLELKEIWILIIPHQAYFDSYHLKWSGIHFKLRINFH